VTIYKIFMLRKIVENMFVWKSCDQVMYKECVHMTIALRMWFRKSYYITLF